ncbi:MAG TPA: hypothetical protein VGI19_13480 [Candidatus Cybelea sp.]|jgi:hypothetical protein
MSSYLHRLVARTLGQANVVRPRLRPRFLVAPGDDRIEAEIATLLRAPDPPALANERAAVEDCDAGVTLSQTKGAFDNRVTLSASKGDGDIAPLAPDGSIESASDDFVSARVSDGFDFVTADWADRRVTLSLSKGDGEGALAADGFVGGNAYGSSLTTTSRDGSATRGLSIGDTAHHVDLQPPARGAPVTANVPDGFATLRQTQGDTASFDRSVPTNASYVDRDVPLAPARIASSSGDPPRNDNERSEDATVVNVSIGRIELRSAPEPATRVLREARLAPQKPREQLDAYLRGRNASKR